MKKNKERMNNSTFHFMTIIMNLIDFFTKHSNKKFKTLELQKGQIVVDYGCGPARFVQNSSYAVGKHGKVFAVDIHPLAIKKVNEKIKKFHLKNVEAILSTGYKTYIKESSVDIIYALDMFHMIENTNEFLGELYRILKQNGMVILEDGHQSRVNSKDKIKNFGLFEMVKESKYDIRYKKGK